MVVNKEIKNVSYDTSSSSTSTRGSLTTAGTPAALVKCEGGFKFLGNGPLPLTGHNFLILIDCCTLFPFALAMNLLTEDGQMSMSDEGA